MSQIEGGIIEALTQAMALAVEARHANLRTFTTVTGALGGSQGKQMAQEIEAQIKLENDRLSEAYGKLIETNDVEFFCDRVRSILGFHTSANLSNPGSFFNSVFRIG